MDSTLYARTKVRKILVLLCKPADQLSSPKILVWQITASNPMGQAWLVVPTLDPAFGTAFVAASGYEHNDYSDDDANSISAMVGSPAAIGPAAAAAAAAAAVDLAVSTTTGSSTQTPEPVDLATGSEPTLAQWSKVEAAALSNAAVHRAWSAVYTNLVS
jgi:hypothetical protein